MNNCQKILAIVGTIFALLATAWGGTTVLDNRYVAASELKSLSVEIFYREFWDAEERLRDAKERGDQQAIKDQQHRLERLKAKICSIEPNWQRCGDGT